MPPCISTALPPAVHHDTSGGRAAVVFVGAILHKLGKLTKPTTTTTTQEKINRSSATPLTPRATFVGVRNAAQHPPVLPGAGSRGSSSAHCASDSDEVG
jgi:hypothetical protein